MLLSTPAKVPEDEVELFETLYCVKNWEASQQQQQKKKPQQPIVYHIPSQEDVAGLFDGTGFVLSQTKNSPIHDPCIAMICLATCPLVVGASEVHVCAYVIPNVCVQLLS